MYKIQFRQGTVVDDRCRGRTGAGHHMQLPAAKGLSAAAGKQVATPMLLGHNFHLLCLGLLSGKIVTLEQRAIQNET